MMFTLPETNISPENQWLEYEFPFSDGSFFKGPTVGYKEGNMLQAFYPQKVTGKIQVNDVTDVPCSLDPVSH